MIPERRAQGSRAGPLGRDRQCMVLGDRAREDSGDRGRSDSGNRGWIRPVNPGAEGAALTDWPVGRRKTVQGFQAVGNGKAYGIWDGMIQRIRDGGIQETVRFRG